MKIPNWQLWVLVILGDGNIPRLASIDWSGVDATYSITTVAMFGVSAAAGVVLVRRSIARRHEVRPDNFEPDDR